MKDKSVLIIDGNELPEEKLLISGQTRDEGRRGTSSIRSVQDLLALKPDIIIIDVDNLDHDPSFAISLLRKEHPQTRIITIGRPDRNETAGHLYRNGNKSCLLTDTTIETLISTIEEVCQGEIILSPAMGIKLSKDLLQPEIPEHLRKIVSQYNLNPREIEVLQLLIKGATFEEIAHRLSITEITVKAHCNNIFDKLNVVNRYQAASLIIERSIVSDRK